MRARRATSGVTLPISRERFSSSWIRSHSSSSYAAGWPFFASVKAT
jgi:hypothetical protein